MATVALTQQTKIGQAIEEALEMIPVESILRDKIVARRWLRWESP